VPFLFITYLAMEWLERKTEESSVRLLSGVGRYSHLLGAGIGLVPQCGFSAGAASLYSGGVITAGTLIAVFLSTSDEMLPIFISSAVAPATIGRILAIKFVIALISGFTVDFVWRFIRRRNHHSHDHADESVFGLHEEKHIHDLCEQDHCGCEDEEGGIFHSALVHTLKITAFIFVVSLALSLLVGFFGHAELAGLMTESPIAGNVVSGLVGLIPNCAASVAITQLYLEGMLTSGQLMSGLLTSAGVGILVLMRTNHHAKENAAVICTLWALGVAWGIFIDLTPIGF
jgi:hypothetical protein